jgi:hypothetical protein
VKNLVNRLLGRTAPASPGAEFARNFRPAGPSATARKVPEPNPREAWFDARTEGAGVWKWAHYFEVYHRHLAKFRGRSPVVLEVGIFSGGSIDLWRDYFGTGTRYYGCDIAPACKAYERPGVEVVIGDQGSRSFWRDTLARIPAPDVVLDDGSHDPAHQRTTLEAVLPHLKPGGVYVCEDVHGRGNPFAAFARGMADELNAANPPTAQSESRAERPCTPFQSAVHSLHFYPFVAVVERRDSPLPALVSERRGTRWQPFLPL